VGAGGGWTSCPCRESHVRSSSTWSSHYADYVIPVAKIEGKAEKQK